MGIAADLAAATPAGSDRRETGTPEAWRPRFEADEKAGGYVVSPAVPLGQSVDAAEVIREFGENPEAWRVTGVRRSKWQRWDGEWLEAHRLTVVPAQALGADLDAEALIDEVRR